MSLIKGEVISIIERTDETILVKAKYVNHGMFAPLGFDYQFNEKLSEDIKDGFIWVLSNYPNSKIIAYPDGHIKIMKEFNNDLNNLFNKDKK